MESSEFPREIRKKQALGAHQGGTYIEILNETKDDFTVIGNDSLSSRFLEKSKNYREDTSHLASPSNYIMGGQNPERRI